MVGMLGRTGLLLVVGGALLLAGSGNAAAQGARGRNGQPASPIPAPIAAWPRLDPGAVLCKTEDDLDRRLDALSGGGDAGGADCRRVIAVTAIAIVTRRGPGRTEVQLSDGSTGWTDAYLPASPPPGSRSVPIGTQ